jgi:hypothetical protein
MKKTDQIIYNDNQRRYEITMRLSDYLKENNYEVEYSIEKVDDYIHHCLEVKDSISEQSYITEFFIRLTEGSVGHVSSLADITVDGEVRLFRLLYSFAGLENDLILSQQTVNNSTEFDELISSVNETFIKSEWQELKFNFYIE